MKRKVFLIILTTVLALTLSACTTTTSKYTGEHIAFDYSDDWEIEVDESGVGTNQIMLVNKSDFRFVFNVESLGDVKEEEIIAQIVADINQSYETANHSNAMEVVAYEDVVIDGGSGKELTLNIQLLDSLIQELYYSLLENMEVLEISDYIQAYEVDAFISEMKNDPNKLEELKTRLNEKETENQEQQLALLLANGFIDNASHYLNEESDVSITQSNIVVVKDNVLIRMYFTSKASDYEKNAAEAQKIIDSITFL
ncbi:hypothetical protein RH915_04430 [Serpentinicella sp. ANB-PHB4]|uniref:hypothetical protein n=1 Tax=Serpentinicella sp. ANB-PHB4 TaxID=3074076 RepID=UPI002861D34E|nr:hypothetical protein [Serpentinicella sp. ANB-PHB4]MDR5658729.1 hypothetical protein [Serpentinicella sp. ANB-PHB4]